MLHLHIGEEETGTKVLQRRRARGAAVYMSSRKHRKKYASA